MKTISTLLLAILICLTGCVVEQPKPARPWRPFDLGDNMSRGEIVLVTMNNCRWCDMQKNTLNRMDISEFKFKEVNHTLHPETRDEYPATSYPTLYITVDGKEHVLVGYQRERELEKLLQK